MSPFWGSFFEDFKERGRDGKLFLITLAGLGGIIVVGCILKETIGENNFDAYGGVIVVCLSVVAVVWFAGIVYRIFFRKPDRASFSRLSSDEMLKARSKLVKNQNRRNL